MAPKDVTPVVPEIRVSPSGITNKIVFFADGRLCRFSANSENLREERP